MTDFIRRKMSRHFGGNLDQDGKLYYGFDAPSGGYFWDILDKNEEWECGRDGLTLTALRSDLKEYVFIDISPDILVKEFIKVMSNEELAPTSLQIENAKMFGVDILDLLNTVRGDIIKNYSDCYLP
jgi:hypothetical protein